MAHVTSRADFERIEMDIDATSEPVRPHRASRPDFGHAIVEFRSACAVAPRASRRWPATASRTRSGTRSTPRRAARRDLRAAAGSVRFDSGRLTGRVVVLAGRRPRALAAPGARCDQAVDPDRPRRPRAHEHGDSSSRGLVSGLDTDAIISQLMAVERPPRTRITPTSRPRSSAPEPRCDAADQVHQRSSRPPTTSIVGAPGPTRRRSRPRRDEGRRRAPAAAPRPAATRSRSPSWPSGEQHTYAFAAQAGATHVAYDRRRQRRSSTAGRDLDDAVVGDQRRHDRRRLRGRRRRQARPERQDDRRRRARSPSPAPALSDDADRPAPTASTRVTSTSGDADLRARRPTSITRRDPRASS